MRWLRANEQNQRRTANDAIAIMQSEAGFNACDKARFSVRGMRLPSQEEVGLVALSFQRAEDTSAFLVSLPGSKSFTAFFGDAAERERAAIEKLDGAVVDFYGTVTLADGRQARAVELEPGRLPHQLSGLDWKILHAVIEALKIGNRVYRSAWQGLSADERSHLPDWYGVDFNALSKEILDSKGFPLLKQIRGAISDFWPNDRAPSETKIAQTLRKVGVRIPPSRSRL